MTDGEMSLDAAIRAVAQRALSDSIENLEWENYPEIGEDDWSEVIDRCKSVAYSNPKEFDTAYRILAARAHD